MVEVSGATKAIQTVERKAAAEEPGSKKVDEADAALFEQAMEPSRTPEPQQASQEDSGTPAEAAGEGVEPVGVGDMILQNMEKLRGNYQERIEEIGRALDEALSRKDVNMAELLKMQWEISKLQLEVETTAKGVDKVDEGLKTLFRSQG